MKRKIISILTLLLTLTSLCACSTKTTVTENGTVDATTNITWSSEKDSIVVSTITLKCNDNYYGVVVNDSINFNNKNNYFTTDSGLTVQITNTDEVAANEDYTYKSQIDEGVKLYVSGSDEELVKSVFSNVFKTNKESYQMFSHDINNDWTNNVIITSDVVSFSNGTDTTYIYQNEGSLSPGSFEGKVEPTVFKKQLRGIDIPITYPEDIDGVSNYIPYGTETYEHWSNEGYTPYSAYDLYTIETITNAKGDTTEKINSDNTANFIILANSDDNVLNLFEEKNNHTQILYSLSSSKAKLNSSLEIKEENLSEKKEIASSVINSDNRYHFGVLSKSNTYSTPWSESNTNGYYVDNYNLGSSFKIAGQMNGKLVMPTIKYSVPAYADNGFTNNTLEKYGIIANYSNLEKYGNIDTIDYKYAASILNQTSRDGRLQVANHGAMFSYDGLLENNGSSVHQFLYYILEGDYIYYFDNDNRLYILENTATTVLVEEEKINKLMTNLKDGRYLINNDDSYSLSCFADSENNLYQDYELVSIIKY